MDFIEVAILLIVSSVIFVVGPKFVRYIERKPERKMDTDDFTLSRPKAISWMWAIGGLYVISLFFLVSTQGGTWDDLGLLYIIMMSLTLGIVLYLIRLNFYRIKVKEGNFHYRPVFKRSTTFTVADIKKVERTTKAMNFASKFISYSEDGVPTIIIYSENGELLRVKSSLKGYGTFIKFLREEELID